MKIKARVQELPGGGHESHENYLPLMFEPPLNTFGGNSINIKVRGCQLIL